jgi:hypothetical protein
MPLPSRLTSPPSEHAAFRARNEVLSRRLLLALVVFCTAMMLLGPTIAEYVLRVLWCPSNYTCNLVERFIGSRFTALLRADQLLDVPFIFLVQFWPLVVAWIGWIAYIRYRKPPLAPRSPREALLRRLPHLRWSRRLSWISLIGLILFCVFLGTPVLSTFTAKLGLTLLDCDVSLSHGVFPIGGGFGTGSGPEKCLSGSGFWIPRLKDYVAPIAGWISGPYLLLLHFHWLLAIWSSITVALFAATRLIERRSAQ